MKKEFRVISLYNVLVYTLTFEIFMYVMAYRVMLKEHIFLILCKSVCVVKNLRGKKPKTITELSALCSSEE